MSGPLLGVDVGHLYRTILEATDYSVRHIFESMMEVGGGAKGGL